MSSFQSTVTDVPHLLSSPLVKTLLGNKSTPQLAAITLSNCDDNWAEYLHKRVDFILKESEDISSAVDEIVTLGRAALDGFLQANITGPPLTWRPEDLLLPPSLFQGTDSTKEGLQQRLFKDLSVDGEAVYQLLPHVELFSLAKCLLNNPAFVDCVGFQRQRLRVNVWHQRLLNEIAPSLQDAIYDDLSILQADSSKRTSATEQNTAEFLIERASIHILHGFEAKARVDLERAAKERGFEFVLTGRLGKRTKFQEKELSQLVVLAKSASPADASHAVSLEQPSNPDKPQTLDLNDDTLLESIAFSAHIEPANGATGVESLPQPLASLDPGNQPLLEPLDAIILLDIASSITNTSPSDGLTREETLPYAERVISGGSSNWQVYTQALIVRSRIEGYKSRTIERGVLQLQAVVDQVIADTTPSESITGESSNEETPKNGPSTFLPQPKASESAPAWKRLQYVDKLASPTRWKLEAELAQRWVSLGGLRTALEIYERLQMWAEVALCWAATDREDKARAIIRRQLYRPQADTSMERSMEDEEEVDAGEYTIERDPLPGDAPRLFCILGDLEKSVPAYERAWEVSRYRYARAQRSLGKHYMAQNDLPMADAAYTMSLKVNPQNHATWFALGSIRLQLANWSGAVEAFRHAIQIDDTDAESWSNLAVALLKFSPVTVSADGLETDEQKNVRESFVALKRAATLKRESFRIWQNLLSISIRLSPAPYNDIVIAQTRLIEILGPSDGEKCIDIPIVEALLAHIIAESAQTATDEPETDERSPRRGLEKMVIDLIQKKITPLITSSRRLWLLTAKLSLHLKRPLTALDAYEKAWRSTINQPGWDTALTTQSRDLWKDVADATVDLTDAYESLGERSRESGLGEGELVSKDWKFKARSAARSVLARAKGCWEGDDAYEALNDRLQELKTK